MASAPAPAAPRETLGALTSELDNLRDQAVALFVAYENDESVVDLAATARFLGGRAFSLAEALDGIAVGLAQLCPT